MIYCAVFKLFIFQRIDSFIFAISFTGMFPFDNSSDLNLINKENSLFTSRNNYKTIDWVFANPKAWQKLKPKPGRLVL